MRKTVLCFLLLVYLTLGAAAQVILSATADKTALTLDDELTLTVRISGISGNLIMPQLPSLPAFNVYSREVEQNSINGKTTLIFRYTMLPRFVGQTTIGPVTFTYQGMTYKTDPIEVRIYRNGSNAQATLPTSPATSATSAGQPTGQLPGSTVQTDPNLPPLEAALAKQAYALGTQPFFMVAAVSNSHPYVNQEFTLAVRFYYSRAFYDAPYQKPSVSNLFLEDAASAEGTQNINGVLYRYQEQRYTLMGAAPGPAMIGSATVSYHTGSSPLSALDRLFGGSVISEEKKAVSAPIQLQIRALPAGAPDSFYGAVGQGYTFQAHAKPQQVEAGEAVNLTATVRGSSNLKPTRDLHFPSMEGFKSYPSASTAGSTATSTGTPRTYKTFKTVLVPAASGIYTIPSLEWSYFNPYTSRYHTLSTEPLTVTVTPATKAANSFDFSVTQPAATGFQTLGQDISYLKTSYAPSQTWLAQLGAWKWINALGLAAVAFCVLFASFGRKSLAKKKAFLTAKAHLKKATASTQIAEAVSTYLHQKLKINTSSLPLKDITQAMHRKGVRPATTESFALLWQRLDAARFAPSDLTAQSTRDLSSQALEVLSSIEEELK